MGTTREGPRAELCDRTCRASGPTPRRRSATWRQTRQRQPRQPAVARHPCDQTNFAVSRRTARKHTYSASPSLRVASTRSRASTRAGSHAANAGLCIGRSVGRLSRALTEPAGSGVLVEQLAAVPSTSTWCVMPSGPGTSCCGDDTTGVAACTAYLAVRDTTPHCNRYRRVRMRMRRLHAHARELPARPGEGCLELGSDVRTPAHYRRAHLAVAWPARRPNA